MLAPVGGRFSPLLQSLVEYVGLQAVVCEDRSEAMRIAERSEVIAAIVAEVDDSPALSRVDADSFIVRLMLRGMPVCHVWKDARGVKRMQSYVRGESSLVVPLALPALRAWVSAVAEHEPSPVAG